MTNNHEKRKMVTIFDILVFFRDYTGEDSLKDFAERTKLSVDVAESMLNAAEDLGYIDDHDELTHKGVSYLEECSITLEDGGTLGVLTLVRGLPGSGKTELGKRMRIASINSAGRTIQHVEADQFMVDDEGQYKFQPDKVKLVNVECIAQAEKYLRQGYDVVVTNVFAQYWEIKPYYDIAATLGIKTVLITMQSQFYSDSRSSKTRHQMVEKWEDIFLPRNWPQHPKEPIEVNTESSPVESIDNLMKEAVDMPLED